ncbi:MAG: DUF1826 domain-containing protein [Pseudomonadota bacterium]
MDMRQVSSDQLGDFAAIYDADVELVCVARPQAQACEAVSKQLVSSRQVPSLRWMQAAGDAGAPASALPATVDAEVRAVLVEQVAEAGEVLRQLMGCEQVGVRLETLNAPMCPRFHVDHVPCRMLITLSGAGTEWISHADVDWTAFADPETTAPPVRDRGQVRHLATGQWSLLKGGAWVDGFDGVVHRSPNAPGGRLLLSLDPIL